MVQEVGKSLTERPLVTQHLAVARHKQETGDGRVGAVVQLGRTHTHGQCQQQFLHLIFIEAVLRNQFILDFQRIQFLEFLGQIRHLCDAVEPHQAGHFGQQTSHVQINHRQVAAENLVGHVAVLQHATQTLNHQHPRHHVVFLTFRIDFIDGRRGKLHARLLKLEVGRASAVEQRNHHPQPGTYAKARERGIHRIKRHTEIRTVVRLGLQIEDSHLVEELLHSVGRSHVVFPALTDGSIDEFGHRSKILPRNPLVDVLPFQMDKILLQNILTRTVVFLALYHRHRKTERFVLLHIGSSAVHVAVGQQPEKRIQFPPFSFRRFKCHNLFIF